MSPSRQIRVIVGEDQAFVREGIVHVLTDGGSALDPDVVARLVGRKQ